MLKPKHWPALRRHNACQLRPGPSLWPEHTGPALGREAACRPLPATWENAGRTRSHCRAGRSVSGQFCSGHTLEIQESRPLSQDFCNPNYREMIENVPPNQCRHSLQGSYPKALLIGSRQFSKPQKYIKIRSLVGTMFYCLLRNISWDLILLIPSSLLSLPYP